MSDLELDDDLDDFISPPPTSSEQAASGKGFDHSRNPSITAVQPDDVEKKEKSHDLPILSHSQSQPRVSQSANSKLFQSGSLSSLLLARSASNKSLQHGSSSSSLLSSNSTATTVVNSYGASPLSAASPFSSPTPSSEGDTDIDGESPAGSEARTKGSKYFSLPRAASSDTKTTVHTAKITTSSTTSSNIKPLNTSISANEELDQLPGGTMLYTSASTPMLRQSTKMPQASPNKIQTPSHANNALLKKGGHTTVSAFPFHSSSLSSSLSSSTASTAFNSRPSSAPSLLALKKAAVAEATKELESSLQFLALARKGQEFWKHGRRGKSHERTIRIDVMNWRSESLIECPPNPQILFDWGSDRMVVSRDDIQIKEGKVTENFQRSTASKVHPDVCFSIVGKTRSLDLEAHTSSIKQQWVEGLSKLLSFLPSLSSDTPPHSLQRALAMPTGHESDDEAREIFSTYHSDNYGGVYVKTTLASGEVVKHYGPASDALNVFHKRNITPT